MRSTVRQRFPWKFAYLRFGIWIPYRFPPRENWPKIQKQRANARHGHPAPFGDSDAIKARLARINGENARAQYLEIRSKLSCITLFNHRRMRSRRRERPWFLVRMREDKVFCRKCGAQVSCHIEGRCPPDPFADQDNAFLNPQVIYRLLNRDG